MTQPAYDAIVVGAGPAGATAAHDLGRAGLRTLLVEKHRLPRTKVCGGGVTVKAARALPFDASAVFERTIATVDLSWRLARSTTLRSGAPLVYMVRRSRFDAFLTGQALASGNVTLLDGVAVQAVDVDERRVRIATSHGSFTADYLVGADGATGPVARALGLMGGRDLLPAVESEIVVDARTTDAWRERLGLDIGFLRGSYGWVFPKDDHLNVGVGCFATTPGIARGLNRYAAQHLRDRVPGALRVIRRSGFVLPLRRPGAPIQRGRVMLAGDAAGLVEAFTGEGIYWAVRSGRIAAEAILAHSRSGAGEPGYQQAIDTRLMPDLLDARRWAHLYLWWPRSCYALPQHVPAVWRAVQKLLRGERGYARIRARLGPFAGAADLLPVELR